MILNICCHQQVDQKPPKRPRKRIIYREKRHTRWACPWIVVAKIRQCFAFGWGALLPTGVVHLPALPDRQIPAVSVRSFKSAALQWLPDTSGDSQMTSSLMDVASMKFWNLGAASRNTHTGEVVTWLQAFGFWNCSRRRNSPPPLGCSFACRQCLICISNGRPSWQVLKTTGRLSWKRQTEGPFFRPLAAPLDAYGTQIKSPPCCLAPTRPTHVTR